MILMRQNQREMNKYHLLFIKGIIKGQDTLG